MKSANLFGAFKYEDIKRFLERAFAGKLTVYDVEKPDFTHSECDAQPQVDDNSSKTLVNEVLEAAKIRETEQGPSPTHHKKPKSKPNKRDL